MKELSIEQKAEAYDKALEYAHYLINERCKEDTDGSFHRADLQKMFHGIEESKDERIKKRIIHALHGDILEMSEIKEAVDWLEKQGKWNNSIWHKVKPNEYVLEKTLICKKNGEIDLVEDTILSVTDAKYALPVSSLGIPKLLEKQDEKEYVLKSSKDKDFVHKFVQCIEKEAKAYEINLPNRGYDIYAFAKDILDWLENQGDQKPAEWHREDEQNLNACLGYIQDEFLRRWLKDVIHVKYDKLDDNIEALFGVGDIISNGISEVKIVSIDKNYYIVTNDEIENDANVCNWVIYFKNQDDWKLVEQKSIDKVEPKFKVEKDKWYVCISQYCNCIEGRNYKATSDGRIIDDYGTEYDMHSDAYKWFRPWTIQDAKDGDVLVTLDYILIFKEFLKNDGGISYCHYDFGAGNPQFIWLEDKNWYFGKEAIIHPATKEQRDLLFQKMHEAGYEWDAEKKELKKIEQKQDVNIQINPSEYINDMGGNGCYLKNTTQNPTWSEEDRDYYDAIITKLEITQDDASLTDNQMKFLKSLKDKIQLQNGYNPYKEVVESIAEMCKHYDKASHSGLRDFYDNVKVKCKDAKEYESLFPRHVWKPTDEQMKALSAVNVNGRLSYIGQGQELIYLYQDLKKLKGE